MKNGGWSCAATCFYGVMVSLSLVASQKEIRPNESLDTIESIINKEIQAPEGLKLSDFLVFFDQSKIPPTLKAVLDTIVLRDVTLEKNDTMLKVGGAMYSGSEQREVALSDIFVLNALPLPEKIKVALAHTKIIKPVIYLTIAQSKLKNLFLEGGVNLFGQKFIIKLNVSEPAAGTYIAPGTGSYAMSAAFIATSYWKFGDLIPELKFLDGVKLADSSFVLSNVDYRDEACNIAIKAGFNIKAGVELTGALHDIKTFVDKILSHKKLQEAGGMSRYIVTDELALYCSAYLSADLKHVQARFEIPVKIGVNFYELYKDGKLKSKPPINKITTSGFTFVLEARADKLSFSGATGIYLYPATQQEPLLFAGGVAFKTNGVEMVGFMKGIYDPAFGVNWLSFGSEKQPIGLSLLFDYTLSGVAAAFGIPLPTGIKMAGAVGLGKKEHRTNLEGVASFEITSAAMSSFFVSGSIDQIDFTRLIELLASLGTKKFDNKKIPELPNIKFSHLQLTVAPFDTVVFDTMYHAGIFASAQLDINKFHALGKVALTSADQRLAVDAYIEPYKSAVFELTGLGQDKILGTSDDKARLEMDIALERSLDKQKIVVDGIVAIPPLACKGAVLFDLNDKNFEGRGAMSLFNGQFSVDAKLLVFLDELESWNFAANFKSDFDAYFVKGLQGGFDDFKQKYLDEIKKYDEIIAAASGTFDLKSEFEINKRKKQLEEIDQKLAKLQLKEAERLNVAGPHNIHLYNHTDKKLYGALYYVTHKNNSKELAALSGNIIELKPLLKCQLIRPDKKLKKDREFYFSENKTTLAQSLTKSQSLQLQRFNVGLTSGKKYHIMYDKKFNIYTGSEWASGPGMQIPQLTMEKAALTTYLKAVLTPGVKVSEEVLSVVSRLKKVPEVFVEIAQEVLNAFVKSTHIIKIRNASIEADSQELLQGALPSISVNFEFALPGKQALKITIQDLQFDFKKPKSFFAQIASIVMFQIIPQFKNLIKDIEDIPEYKDAIEQEDL